MKTSKEVAAGYDAVGRTKTTLPLAKMFLFGIFAGAFIALGALGSQIAGTVAGRLAGAFVFPVGLTMVLLVGVELFTGNCLLAIPLCNRTITPAALLRNWAVVYAGNFVGSLLVALAAVYGCSLTGPVAATAMAAAEAKASLPVAQALIRGVMCNVLVCLAVWMASLAGELAGKIMALYLPTMLFVLCGFEHSVANMYFIPAGMMLGAKVTVGQFLWNNLFFVTIGNIVGGAAVVGCGLRALYAPPSR